MLASCNILQLMEKLINFEIDQWNVINQMFKHTLPEGYNLVMAG